MKKLLLVFIVIFSFQFSVGSFSFAQSEDNQIIDALDQLEATAHEQNLQTLDEQLSFETFSSCEDMGSILEDFIKDNFKDNWRRGRGGGGIPIPMKEDKVMLDNAVGGAVMQKSTTNIAVAEVDSFDEQSSSTNDFSTTNTQVSGVDEADILKTDGDYLYYFNQREHKIFVLISPLDITTSTIDLDDAKVIKEINLPKNFNGSQMYLYDDKLVIIAQRWRNVHEQSFIDRNARTDVIVYDVKDPKIPKLLKLSDLDGNYHDSRMIDGKLYIISQLNVNWWYPPQIFEDIDDVEIMADDFLPKTIDIAYTSNDSDRNLTIGLKKYPYHIDVRKANCNEIHYVLPSKESIQQMGMYPSFTVVRMIDIDDTEEEVKTTTAFGSTQTIHVSQEALYLTDPIYVNRAFRCPSNARCILPWFESGQHTLVHKFTLGSSVKYVDSTVVNGSPLTQYSMSEDNHGNFRMLTRNQNRSISTNLYILDDELDVKGMLMNIEPGEEFKSSRYIGDKLYLVTFERTDPLFVIDLENIRKPKIIGKLKIPGFSSYLHPYAKMKNGKQYLIGLGQDAEENQRGGTSMVGIKVDLYEIDYAKTNVGDSDCENYHYSTCPEYCEQVCTSSNCSDPDENGDIVCTDDCDGPGSCVNKKGGDNEYIQVKQLYTKTWGSKNSTTEALHTPRMFVWDEVRKTVVLPMILSETKNTQNCNIVYNENGEEITRNCYDNESYDTTFAGLKAIEIDVDKGISEAYSYNYLDQLKDDEAVYRNKWDGTIYPRQFTQLHFRVGYLGDVLYTLNNLFADFRVMGDGKGKTIKR